MQPRFPHAAFGILRCPICHSDLAPAAGALCCRQRHSFDLAKSGYVNLLRPRARMPARGGDGKAQLRRRDAFLDTGVLDFVADAILRVAPAVPAPLTVVEAGCGTAHHLARVVAGLDASCGLGFDLAKDAVLLASRRRRSLAFAVADVWQPWPIRSGAVDLLINVFAPKNFGEMGRVLHADGLLAVAFAGPDHLAELRRDFGLIGMQDDKARRYRDNARAVFADVRLERHRGHVTLTRAQLLDAVAMGPSAGRPGQHGLAARSDSTGATLDVMLLLAKAPAGRGTARRT